MRVQLVMKLMILLCHTVSLCHCVTVSYCVTVSLCHSPASGLVHHHRHLVLVDLTDEGADHPAGLHGAVVPGGLPHLLSPGHGDLRARLLKLDFSL